MLNNNQLKQLNLWMPVIILTSVIFGGVMWVIYSITITAVILAVINLIKKLLNKKLWNYRKKNFCTHGKPWVFLCNKPWQRMGSTWQLLENNLGFSNQKWNHVRFAVRRFHLMQKLARIAVNQSRCLENLKNLWVGGAAFSSYWLAFQ